MKPSSKHLISINTNETTGMKKAENGVAMISGISKAGEAWLS